MIGPGMKRKGAAQTRGYVASQNNEVLGDNSTEVSRPHVRRRIVSSTPSRSPITRSQTRGPEGSPILLRNKIREMLTRSPSPTQVRTPVATPTDHTHETVIGENLTENEGDPTPLSGHQVSSQETGPSSSSANKIRGPTRGIGLEKLTKAKGKKLVITVSPSKGRPTDPIESAKLSSEIGLMVRHHLPKNTKFKDITEGVIEELLSRVEARFEIDLSQPHVKRVALGIMKDRNRGQRCKLNKYFKSFPSAEEARKNPPQNIDISKWNEMCDYWTSPKFIHRLEVNKKNRRNKAIHTGGSKPFVVHHAEKGDPIEGYKITHQKKTTNEWILPENESAYKEMTDCISEMEAESGNFDNNDKRDIMARVLGKKAGRMIGFGFGPRAKKSSTSEKEKALVVELEASRSINEELKSTIQVQDQRILAQDERINNLENMMNKLAGNPEFLRSIQSTTNTGTGTSDN